MKEQLANRLLYKLLEWSDQDSIAIGGPLQMLARFKYDDYEGYRPGEKFLESLAGWLEPFDVGDRKALATFLLNDLVFVSRPQMDHVIDTVYPDVIRPALLNAVATETDIEPFRVSTIAARTEFAHLQRSTIVFGLSDGARLDRLRRSSRQITHEQFFPTPQITEATQDSALRKLRTAIGSTGMFRRIVLIEDFSGSGFSLLRWDGSSWDGKLWRARTEIESMVHRGFVDEDHSVDVIVYIASDRAQSQLRADLQSALPGWSLNVVMPLGPIDITDAYLLGVASKWFDRTLETDHLRKGGGDPAHGFAGAALPLVLYHNTPNNSISLLWADSTGRPASADTRAIFPREERHRADA